MDFERFRYRRKDPETRKRFQETAINPSDLIWPVFLIEGENRSEDIKTMPGVFRYTSGKLIHKLDETIQKGLQSILLFGIPQSKGIEQCSRDNFITRAIREIKSHFPDLNVITDVCLCSYTVDGHCHIGDNDKTCEILAEIALNYAAAGSDYVAPSDMMDGRVHYIRKKLDKTGFQKTGIISYSAKYASNYYGPFREAADCTPQKGDRKDYQMDPANSEEAMSEISADIQEGAGSIIIKPALAYLDIIRRARDQFQVPIAGFQVSGEYAMLKMMVEKGLASSQIIKESTIAIKRAGAHQIISYFTPDILEDVDGFNTL